MLNTENIDSVRFAEAAGRVALEERLSEGFSVLAERAVHKTVKLYLEPRAKYHEIPLMGSICDILNEDGVTEIQTGSFIPLIPKLKRLLPTHRVRIVHPFAIRTVHRWLDPATGEISEPKRKGSSRPIHAIARELYAIRELIGDKNLSVTLLAYECEEFRALDGCGKDKKRRATLLGKRPTRLVGELTFSSIEDYRVLLPSDLPDEFVAKDFMRAIKSRSRYDAVCLKLLVHLGFIEATGKRGRAILYKRTAN